jgi:hypothetical protein
MKTPLAGWGKRCRELVAVPVGCAYPFEPTQSEKKLRLTAEAQRTQRSAEKLEKPQIQYVREESGRNMRLGGLAARLCAELGSEFEFE